MIRSWVRVGAACALAIAGMRATMGDPSSDDWFVVAFLFVVGLHMSRGWFK